MKRIFILLLITYSVTTYAQDTTFTKADVTLYGTKAEKVHQEAIGRQTQNHFLSRLIGFKVFYADNIAWYLQTNMEYSSTDAYNPKGYFVEVLSKKGFYMGKVKPPKIVLKFAIDKDERIKSGVINGRFSDLASLFMNYWPMSADWNSEVQLKPGIVAQKHCFGDLITFNWAGNTPFIKIVKDPSMSFPVPQLK